jgi:salicylate hydroxylase
MNFNGIIERNDWRSASWTARGTREECRADLPGWHEDVHCMIDNIATPYEWALMGRAPLKYWSSGRVSLLGDACHPTLPMLAQGAAMALEDGFVLARALAAAGADIEQGLARYQNARRERTEKIVRGSAENARRFQDRTPAEPAGAQAYVDREWPEERVKARYEWLSTCDVTTVPV